MAPVWLQPNLGSTCLPAPDTHMLFTTPCGGLQVFPTGRNLQITTCCDVYVGNVRRVAAL